MAVSLLVYFMAARFYHVRSLVNRKTFGFLQDSLTAEETASGWRSNNGVAGASRNEGIMS